MDVLPASVGAKVTLAHPWESGLPVPKQQGPAKLVPLWPLGPILFSEESCDNLSSHATCSSTL